MGVDLDFDEFARAQLPSLVRFAAALTGDTQLAQDLVQDTLVRAYERWTRVAGADRPDLYLRRMVLNAYLSWRRLWYQRTVHTVADPADGPHPVTVDPAGRVADRAQLSELLGRLGRQQRAAIVLRFYEDRDDDEIAEVLGCSPVTVRSHISRGLATLRLRIRAEQDENYSPGEAATA
ncbi:MAG TPA: SigE family RNA polymerase sigma factor [Pseudonocardiaceae bacterium]